MKKCIWGIDLDGVVYQWSNTARFLLNYYHGLNLDESTHWDYIKDNITQEQWKWLWSDGVKKGLFRSGHVYRGSIETLHKLDSIGEIMIITARPESARNDTLDWLAFHRIPASRVVMLSNDENKSSVLPHCDLYVDDKVENCNDLSRNTKGVVLMMDRPWNRVLVDSDVRVVHTWGEIFDKAKSIHDGKL